MESKAKWISAYKEAKQNHFDFVVCDPRTLEVRCAIALSSTSAMNRGRRKREEFMIRACQSSGIPLIATSVKHSYQVDKLKMLLATHIDLITATVKKEVRFCRKCDSPMNTKVASSGEHKGSRFFTCSRHPTCNYTENFNVVGEEF